LKKKNWVKKKITKEHKKKKSVIKTNTIGKKKKNVH